MKKQVEEQKEVEDGSDAGTYCSQSREEEDEEEKEEKEKEEEEEEEEEEDEDQKNEEDEEDLDTRASYLECYFKGDTKASNCGIDKKNK
ncbi:hypothetical protein HZH68_015086 [Vespula germanica]|uniref:Uncharacterized protein n=1 Tax=Vespula germanica TaxID=30212 RepID=A0A834MS13_VESGE|nr:hypothetical protein HZH68_015086 [Vespula germanica]